MLDGTYMFAAKSPWAHRARAPTNNEIERLLDVLIQHIVRTLTCAGTLV